MSEKKTKKTWKYWLILFITIAAVFFLGFLISSISERRSESIYVNQPKLEIKDWEPRNEVWGENYPKEFETYYQTKDVSFRSLYNGNAMIDMLEEDPRLVILWAGYGFSKDYNQGRGHYYAVEDIHNTFRTGGPLAPDEGPMPSTCWTCKSPDVPRLMDEVGIAEFYSGKWASKGHEIVNTIGCSDCHDPETMNLRITRPALVEGFESMGLDIKDATHQEMRSLVCAQCHVEYYFNKKKPGAEGVPYLTFPWSEGLTADAMLKYYDDIEFSDWTHKLSKAPMLKTQHPGWEIFKTGIHAERGVSCADCHMPYHNEGGQKFTNHKMGSPLQNISSSCQVCHRQPEDVLAKNVFDRQMRVIEIRNQAEKVIVHAHVEAAAAWDAGATEEEMKDILYLIRAAQWYWDYAAASHGGSFHSPVEMARVVGKAIDNGQEARVKLARVLSSHGVGEVPYPDIDTKEKAQQYIGLDAEKMAAEKEAFKEKLLPEWKKLAAEREATYPDYN